MIHPIGVDALIRALVVDAGRPVSILLGAGASISSGMPSAERCVWEWKREIFVTNNPTLRETVGELSLPGTRTRIQRWLDQRGGYLPLGDEGEYSFYAKKCYLTSEHRRKFFQSYVEKAKPHTAYQLLPLLSQVRLVRTVWTTNFDGLVARACAAANVTCIEVGIDCAHRSLRPVSERELRLVSLHGDFRYDDLKNTEAELQNQEEALQAALLQDLREHDLLVVGYSGRDDSLMRTLVTAYGVGGNTRLYWCGFNADAPDPVAKLLLAANAAKREAYYVSTEGVDDLITRLALRRLDGEMLATAKEIVASAGDGRGRAMSFVLPPLPATSLVKSNAYQVALPTQVCKVQLAFPESVKWRDWIDEKIEQIFGCAVLAADGVLLLAAASDIKAAFGDALIGTPVSTALADADIAKDTRIQSLVRRALALGISKHLDLFTDRRGAVWEKSAREMRKHAGMQYGVHRALRVRLAFLESKAHAVLTPAVVITDSNGQLADEEIGKTIRNAVYGYQHNDVYDSDLKYWTAKVAGVEIPSPGGGVFRVAKAPIYAGLAQKGRKPLPQDIQQHARQVGLVVQDANLVFCASSGSKEVSDFHPLRGLLNNRPWDYELTSSGLSPKVDVAVIVPKRDSPVLRTFLATLNQGAKPSATEKDYLLDFPGFSRVFGLPLVCAQPGDALWQDLDDTIGGDKLSAAKALATKICRALDALRAVQQGAVTIIYVPARWMEYEVVNTEEEQFNLHDFVKAYAARVGHSTQFIRERTTATTQPCRVRWWLSLALYAKALRTPWRLDSIDEQTAFVGIGYSIDRDAPIGSHILLGCSHIYSARGEGLQFRLGRIEDPIMRGKNPFMSENDARRTGDTIRQLFFDAKMRLPRRVVVHKKTEFTEDEQRGFSQGLEGVENIELVEINVEESLRYLASKEVHGKLEIDRFPIPRGATVVLDAQSALLWVHGSAANVQNPRFKYYQGKRRIPAPLRIRRFMGQSDLVQVVTEVLGLSKMNWNHFDYYSRVPATLESASAIAKVGTYLSGFGSAPYDYRLLI